MRLTCRHHIAPPSLPLSNLVTPFLASPEESVLKKEHRPVLVKKNDSVGFEYPRNFLPYKYYHRKGGESSRYRYRYKVVSGCCSNKNKNKWKALKCQTLGASVHVIVLVCWLDCLVTHACHAHSVLFLPMQSLFTNFWRSFTGLVQFVFSFPSWFHTIWFYCSHTYVSLTNYTLLFLWIERHDHSVRMSSYLTGTAALHCGHTFVGDILTANGQ